MTIYILRNGVFVNKATGEPMDLASDWTPASPYTVSDIQPYQSPITGEWITGRTARREDLKKHDCVEKDPPKKRHVYGEAFARKYGLQQR